MMKYKGYTGRVVQLDENQGLFHGEVTGITDVITFQGRTTEELLQGFHESIDDYLEFCKERSEEPEKPYSGKFLVRVPGELHRKAVLAARTAGQSLNTWVAEAIEAALVERGALPAGSPQDPFRALVLEILEKRALEAPQKPRKGRKKANSTAASS